MNINQKILVSLVIILILINVVLMSFIWKNRPSQLGPMRPMPFRTENFFEKQLDFDEVQLAEFRKRMIDHQLRINQLQLEIRQVNRELHEAIILKKSKEEEQVSAQLDSLAFLIKDETTSHIRGLAEICRPNQKKRLIEALNRLPDRKGNRGDRKKARRHGKGH